MNKEKDFQDKANELGVPVIPRIKKQYPQDTNPVIAICGECGLEIRRIMHYCCQKANCPCDLRNNIYMKQE